MFSTHYIDILPQTSRESLKSGNWCCSVTLLTLWAETDSSPEVFQCPTYGILSRAPRGEGEEVVCGRGEAGYQPLLHHFPPVDSVHSETKRQWGRIRGMNSFTKSLLTIHENLFSNVSSKIRRTSTWSCTIITADWYATTLLHAESLR